MNNELNNFLSDNNIDKATITHLPLSGGDRNYYRVLHNGKSLIATVSNDIKENKTFFSFTNTFTQLQLPVPTLMAISADNTMYLQQDLGSSCLLDAILATGYTHQNYALYEMAISQLAKLNILAHSKIDYNLCLVNQQFDETAALFDLNYCLQYYVDAMHIQYDNILLQKEFIQLSKEIGSITPSYFMYRDCQGRNIMAQDNQIYFIDYQGGMQGPLGYDVASLLWQAKAQLPDDWKQSLLQLYITQANLYLSTPIDVKSFLSNYYKIVLMRLLQVLGAYGRRGLVEGKFHFISSIPQGIDNIIAWMKIADIQEQYSTIHQLLHSIITSKK